MNLTTDIIIGIFGGDAPQFIILSLIAAFWVGFFSLAHALIVKIDPHDKGIYKKQMNRIFLVSIFLLIALSLILFRIVFCNFVQYTFLSEINPFIHWFDFIILLLLLFALVSARNFFKKGLTYEKEYRPYSEINRR